MTNRTCMFGLSNVPVSATVLLHYGNVPTQCDILAFHCLTYSYLSVNHAFVYQEQRFYLFMRLFYSIMEMFRHGVIFLAFYCLTYSYLSLNHAFVCQEQRFYLFLRLFYCIMEMFRHIVIFLAFHFFYIFISVYDKNTYLEFKFK